MKEPHLVFE